MRVTNRRDGHLAMGPRPAAPRPPGAPLARRGRDPVGADHPRGPLHRDRRPRGDRALVPLRRPRPRRPGEYGLEVDLVHEGVRWFGCAIRVPLMVAGRDAGSRAPVTAAAHRPPPRPARVRRTAATTRLIPPVVHRVWSADAAMPAQQVAFGEGWARLNPGWDVRLWTDADVAGPRLGPGLVRPSAQPLRALRRAALRDPEPLRRRLRRHGRRVPAAPRPAARRRGRVRRLTRPRAPRHGGDRQRSPGTRCAPGRRDASGTPSARASTPTRPGRSSSRPWRAVRRPTWCGSRRAVFYPYGYDEPHRRDERFPDAYAVHHWARTWG